MNPSHPAICPPCLIRLLAVARLRARLLIALLLAITAGLALHCGLCPAGQLAELAAAKGLDLALAALLAPLLRVL